MLGQNKNEKQTTNKTKQNKNKQNTPMTKMKNQAKMVNRLVKASAGRSLQVGHAPPVQGFKMLPHTPHGHSSCASVHIH